MTLPIMIMIKLINIVKIIIFTSSPHIIFNLKEERETFRLLSSINTNKASSL